MTESIVSKVDEAIAKRKREALAIRMIEQVLAAPFNFYRMLVSTVSIIAVGASLPPMVWDED